jgi:hypothetical protein
MVEAGGRQKKFKQRTSNIQREPGARNAGRKNVGADFVRARVMN